MGHYTYLFINILTLFFPLLLSFDKKVHFISYLKHLIVGIILTALVFIPWDMGFTAMGIWSFNTDYNLGIYIGNMPLEEYLFFFTVPYACIFIYECLKAYVKRDFFKRIHFAISALAVILLLVLIVNHTQNTYTAISSAFLVLLLLIQIINGRNYMGRFYASYLVCLIPFIIVNGVLTSLPVIKYNDISIIGLRLGTIPVEDFIYNGGLLLLTTMGYEWSRRKFSNPVLKEEINETSSELIDRKDHF